jgi:hypothetical protein
MDKVRFDAGKPDLSLLRQVILRRLRSQPGWNTLDANARDAYHQYLELHRAEEVLNRSVLITGIYDMIRMQRNDLGHPR